MAKVRKCQNCKIVAHFAQVYRGDRRSNYQNVTVSSSDADDWKSDNIHVINKCGNSTNTTDLSGSIFFTTRLTVKERLIESIMKSEAPFSLRPARVACPEMKLGILSETEMGLEITKLTYYGPRHAYLWAQLWAYVS